MKDVRQKIAFVLDGRLVEVDMAASSLKPTTTALNYLRSLPGHKGTKEGCAVGDCGACTVVLGEAGDDGRMQYKAVNSCILFLPMIHGKQLITVENLARKGRNGVELHPVQQALVDALGSQCGFCTPGFVMSLFALYKSRRRPDLPEIRQALAGNLCRCTGYASIIGAAQKACNGDGKDHFSETEKEVTASLRSINKDDSPLTLLSTGCTYHKPFTLSAAMKLRGEHPGALIVNGATDAALLQGRKPFPEFLDISAVKELMIYEESNDGVVIGAGLSLEQLRMLCAASLPALHDMLGTFGSMQIRNSATLGGNLGSASPIGDSLPLLMAYKAEVVMEGAKGERKVAADDFILGYHKPDIRQGELLTKIIVRKPPAATILKYYKVSKRKEVDIATVSAAFRIVAGSDGSIRDVVLAFGGMAAVPVRARKTESSLAGKKWSRPAVSAAGKLLLEEFDPISDMRSDADTRRLLAGNLLLKCWNETGG